MKRLLCILIIFTLTIGVFSPIPAAIAAPRPSIVISGYQMSPSKVYPGDSFSLSLTIKNNGGAAAENVSVLVSGSSLSSINASNANFIESLGKGSQTTLTFNLKSDEALSPTNQSLTVDFSYEDSIATPFTSTQTIGVIFSKKTASAAKKPRLYVSSYLTNPLYPKAGDVFTLYLKITNKGNASAKDITATISPTLASVVQSANKKYISKIRPNKSAQISFMMLASKEAVGLSEAPVSIDYDDLSANNYQSSQNVTLAFSKNSQAVKDNSTKAAPKILISKYNTNPQEISPGERFSIDLVVKNVSSQNAKNISVSVGSAATSSASTTNSNSTAGEANSSTTSTSESFAAMGSSNVRFIDSLSSGNQGKISYEMMASPGINPGLYNLGLNIAYLDSNNKANTSSENIGLIIKRKPTIAVNIGSSPGSIAVGDNYKVPFDIQNTSEFSVKGIKISAFSDGVSTEVEKETSFIGTIDSGDSETSQVSGIGESTGEKEILLRIQYLDDFGQKQTLIKPVKINVTQKSKETKKQKVSQKKSSSILGSIFGFFKALLGIG